jgi:hypothetical protein
MPSPHTVVQRTDGDRATGALRHFRGPKARYATQCQYRPQDLAADALLLRSGQAVEFADPDVIRSSVLRVRRLRGVDLRVPATGCERQHQARLSSRIPAVQPSIGSARCMVKQNPARWRVRRSDVERDREYRRGPTSRIRDRRRK